MRNPVIVFERIQKYLPENLKHEMDWYINNAMYKAPEEWPDVYRLFHNFLMNIVGRKIPLKEKWKIQIILIFADKNIYDLISERIVNKDDVIDFIEELKLVDLKVEHDHGQ